MRKDHLANMINLKENHQKKTIPYFRERGYKNSLSVPFIQKVVINIGMGSLLKGSDSAKDLLKEIKEDVALISGQIPRETKARTSIAGFGVREGQLMGLKVTLRGKRMIDFLERLVNIALPRTKDFAGLAEKNFDAQGNLTIGVRDYSIFPEASLSKVLQRLKRSVGLEITVVTTASTREDGINLLKGLGFPIKNI